MPSVRKLSSASRPRLRAGGWSDGFTLIELLTVLAIVGVLAGILIPATMSVRASADRARTKVLFQQWISALEGFRQEYGSYPLLAADGKVNGGATADPAAVHPFHDALAGRRRNGGPLPEPTGEPAAERPETQNPRRIAFLQVAAGEFFPADDEIPSRRNLLRDPLGNADIAVLVDGNLDGVIDAGDRASLPAVSPPDMPGTLLVPSVADFPMTGLRAGAIFYSAPPGATDPGQLVLSWK